MARPLRIEYGGALYHLAARGSERRSIFSNDRDREKFLETLAQFPERFDAVVHGYVLMDNHYHLLVETRRPNITRAMHYLNATYSGYFNRVHNRAGHLLEGRYKGYLIEKDNYLLAVSRYIHLNPVRAGLAARPETYPWSSYPEYIGKRHPTGWLTCGWVLEQFANDLAQARRLYRRFVEEAVEELENPFKTLVAGLILGSESFVIEIKKKLARETHPDMPQTRILAQGISCSDVLEAVARQFKTDKTALTARGGRNNLSRKICLFLLRTLTDLRNNDICVRFGISHSAVSKAVSSVKSQMEHDRRTRRIVNEIQCNLLNSQFKT